MDNFLGLEPDQSADRQFELLRSTVWSLATPTGRVHINRILSVALPAWRVQSEDKHASDEGLRAELRSGLSALQDAGDLIELRGGYWVPATVRLVELPQGAGHLLIGGMPSDLLPIGQDRIRVQGLYRHLSAPPASLTRLLPCESLASWSRLPTYASLLDWGRGVIDSIERQPYSPSAQDSFEFYLPGRARKATPQFKRWFTDTEAATGTLLARRTRAYGAREYRLIDVDSGRLVGSSTLPGIDVRRLMYCLDLEAQNPVSAQHTLGEDGPFWLLTSELPRPEQRLFSVFGGLTVPEDRPFERRWVFERSEEVALEAMRSLGIVVDTGSQRTR
ncbi:hypothetical protein [Lysobacter sp. 22409]|uniref:hypothetical protein n=1 Tax=Lysobacter sp. 22409 TaxID=3453917 RepID=UPI003F846595